MDASAKLKLGLSALIMTFFVVGCGDEDSGNGGKPVAPQELTLQYIGLKEKANVREAQKYVAEQYGVVYNPKLRLTDDYLYATTAYGLYRKNIATDDTQWEPYAFDGEPVHDFVKKGTEILAITANRDNKAILRSTDDGRTFSNATPDAFMSGADEDGIVVFTLSQNPLDPNSLLMLAHTPNPKMYGLLKSTDFGKSWRVLRPFTFGYQNWVSIFDPHDPTNIYCAGEESVFDSAIYFSNNDGQDWDLIESVNNNCVHHIAFHPANPNIMIYSGEFIVKKSTDKGRTWEMVLNEDLYFFKTIYDDTNPDIMYTSGLYRAPDTSHELTIYRSTNGGDDWSVFFQTNLPGEGGIIDMELRDDDLFLYTYTDGIYKLSIPRNE